jgi:ABC-type bacteriocin/lantibiotic exporter with double-glycine peptidase domain
VTPRAAAAALALVSATGCASLGGRSRTFDESRLDHAEGWTVAASTPAVLQVGSKDCGAAALAMVAGRWRVPLSLEGATTALDGIAASPPGSRADGARLGDLRDVARAHGLTAYAVKGDRDMLLYELRTGRPVVVGVLIPHSMGRARSHYEVVVAWNADDDQYVTIDPARGWRVRSWTELDAEWLPAGRPALVVTGVTQ